MSQGKRPGGLTALAVTNFILGGWEILLAFFSVLHTSEAGARARDWPLAWPYAGLTLAVGLLLIGSGIGYLGQRRIGGRGLGNAYAIAGLAKVGLGVAALPFGIWNIVELLYAAITLFLLNLTFRDDLVYGAERLAPRPPPPSEPPDRAPVHVGPPTGRAHDRLLTGLRLAHVRMIALYWIRFSLRTGGGIVTLLLVLLVGLSVAASFFTPVENLLAKGPAAGFTEGQVAADLKRISEDPRFVEVVRGVTGADESETRYLLSENPALLSVIFLVLMWIFPFIACVGSFNQTASDIGNRGLRYLLLRTERPNILAGRFVGTVGAAKAALALTVVVLLLYAGLKFDLYSATSIVVWGIQGFVAIVLLMVPYIAMCAWISCSTDSAFGALALSLVLAGAPVVFLKIVDAMLVYDLAWLERLIPWGWKYELLSGDVGTRLTAYLAMLGFTALFLFLAFRSFHRRDL